MQETTVLVEPTVLPPPRGTGDVHMNVVVGVPSFSITIGLRKEMVAKIN
jgi:hypothetical protein